MILKIRGAIFPCCTKYGRLLVLEVVSFDGTILGVMAELQGLKVFIFTVRQGFRGFQV